MRALAAVGFGGGGGGGGSSSTERDAREKAAHKTALLRQELVVTGTLGRGAFGVVYEALCLKSREIVAVKVISKAKAAELGVMARVVNEVSLHARMRHPNVVDLLDFFEDDDTVCLVMEPCTGGDLYTLLQRRGPLPYSEVQRLGAQLLSAIAYMHSQGVLHRDLKLSNLLLRERAPGAAGAGAIGASPSAAFDLKVADFGLAVQLSGAPDEEHRTICGTPNYISPYVAEHSSSWARACPFARAPVWCV